MSRWRLALGSGMLMAALAGAQDTTSPYGLPPPFKAEAPKSDTSGADAPKVETSTPDIPKSEMPPEEDKTNAPRVFTFNPVQSKKEVDTGDYYFKKGNYTAAVSRYDEATKWNEGNADAWLHLGEAQEKKSNAKAAREAYKKYLELSPDAKDAPDVKKRLAKLKG